MNLTMRLSIKDGIYILVFVIHNILLGVDYIDKYIRDQFRVSTDSSREVLGIHTFEYSNWVKWTNQQKSKAI